MNIDLCNIEKGLKELFRYAYGVNASLEDSNGLFDGFQLLEDLDIDEVQVGLKELVTALLQFKAQHKNTDKAELVIRTEQFENLLQKLEAELRNHITVENQLKIHIEHHENQIEDLEKAEISEKKNLKKLEVKVSGKKPVRNIEAERVKKEMEEKIKELTEVAEKKEKILHKIEFENIKLRNLLEEKTKECETVKKEIIKCSRITPKRDSSTQGSENERKSEGGRIGGSVDRRQKIRPGKSVDDEVMNNALISPEKKIVRSNTIGQSTILKPRIGGCRMAFAKDIDQNFRS